MAVMTTKDMELAGRSFKDTGGVSASPDSSNRQPRKVVRGAKFPAAPKQGTAQIKFPTPDGPVKVEVKDQLYYFADEDEKKRLMKPMKKAGFKFFEYTTGEKPPKVGEQKRRYRIRYAHPDNAEGDPKTGNVSVKVGRGKSQREVRFELDAYGTIETEDAQVQRKLAKLGWAEIEKQKLYEDEEVNDA